VSHPMFRAILKGQTIKSTMVGNPLFPFVDPSILVPAPVPSVWKSGPPDLKDYVQLPMHLWVPEFFFPHLVPHMPCPVEGCKGVTTRQRWHSGGPRLIHGIRHAVYFHCHEYKCSLHPQTSFSGWLDAAVAKLPPVVQAQFPFVLSGHEGVTLELYNRIIQARVTGYSLNALRREMGRYRHERMYDAISAYYAACEHHMLSVAPKRGVDIRSFWTRGAAPTYSPLPPDLHNPDGYYDHPPPTIDFMSAIAQRHFCESQDVWNRYTQQLTADRVCIDSTFKAPRKMKSSPGRLLWSMMDVQSGCILHQQVLTHEAHNDLRPMFEQYVARCAELGRPLPSRVCSDRGLMDASIVNAPFAFPKAHINVDPWHFMMLFEKTLNKSNILWKEASNQFGEALYKPLLSATGKVEKTHAEPEDIIIAVECIIAKYSTCGTSTPAVTSATKHWWDEQKHRILHHRMCSHPTSADFSPPVASSVLENYHRQLNRVTRLVQCSEITMHGLMGQLAFQWNRDREIALGKRDWGTYDVVLVAKAYDACVRVIGSGPAETLWGGAISIPPKLATVEYFHLLHPHVTLTQRLAQASQWLPFTDASLAEVIDEHIGRDPLIPPTTLSLLIEATPAVSTVQATAAESAVSSMSTVTASEEEQSASSTSTPPGPLRVLTAEEVNLLNDLIQRDLDLRQAVDAKDWSHCAARWNTFVAQVDKMQHLRDRVRGALHLVLPEGIEKGVKVIELRRERMREAAIAEMKASQPNIPWKPESATAVPFSSYENAQLRKLVPLHSSRTTKKRIKWKSLEAKWLAQYRLEYINLQEPRLQPRDRKTLCHHWQSIEETEGRREARRTMRATATPAVRETEVASSHSDAGQCHTLTPSVGSASLPTLHPSFRVIDPFHPLHAERPSSLISITPSHPSSLPPPSESPPLPVPSPLTLLPSSIINSVGGAVTRALTWSTASLRTANNSTQSSEVVQPQPTAVSTLPSPPLETPSSISTPSPSLSSKSSPAVSAPSEPSKWSAAATEYFHKLWKEAGEGWKYEQFCIMWPKHLYGEVSHMRWENKKRIEKTKAKRKEGGGNEERERGGKKQKKG
jgi:hypothetical protein